MSEPPFAEPHSVETTADDVAAAEAGSAIPGVLMVDPSLLFSEEGLRWLQEDPTAQDGIIVPATFMEWLEGTRSLDRSSLLAPEDLVAFDQHRQRLLMDLRAVPRFSHLRGVTLSPEAEEIRWALVRSEDPADALHADEWVFLQSHSFLVTKLRRPLDAFRNAGSVIVEFGRKTRDQLIRGVIPDAHVPAVLTPQLMARVAVKWIVVGGAAVGGGTLGGVVGTAVGGPAGGLLGGQGGGFAAGELAKAAVLAIDP
jgi:hypothetical protein